MSNQLSSKELENGNGAETKFQTFQTSHNDLSSFNQTSKIKSAIVNMKGLINKAFNCCGYLFNPDKYYSPNVQEEKTLSRNEKIFTESFDPNNKEHQKLLETLVDPRRKLAYEDLGFESDDPKNDFSTGGFYSLKFMNHFLSFYPHEFMDIKLNKLNFPFAMICIKLTHSLKQYLGYTYIEYGTGILPISNKEKKKFIHLLEDNENVCLDILSKSLIYFKLNYKLIVKKNHKDKEKSLSDTSQELRVEVIETLLKECIFLIRECLGSVSVKNKHSLIEFYDSKINKLRMQGMFNKY